MRQTFNISTTKSYVTNGKSVLKICNLTDFLNLALALGLLLNSRSFEKNAKQ